MAPRSARHHSAKVIIKAAEIIEEMESRYPEQVIALAVLDAITAPNLGDDRYVRLGDVKAHMLAFGKPPNPEATPLKHRTTGVFYAVCNRCKAPKGKHTIGESCSNNCGGRIVANV